MRLSLKMITKMLKVLELRTREGKCSENMASLELLTDQVEELSDSHRITRKDMPSPMLDKTFAARLRSFVSNVNVNDLPGEEEKAYLLNTAQQILEWQSRHGDLDTQAYLGNIDYVRKRKDLE